MKKRVTLMMDDELDRRIREYQVRIMLARDGTYSFSDAVNDILARDA